jgi:NADPH:quinone reductase-like Zn-dependent oxidoreductase
MTEQVTLEVRKDNWAETRVLREPLPTDLAENEVLLRIDRQALTSNNITYALAGDTLGYWGFFPAEDGWGRIPAMGWADVIASQHPGVQVGERVWGWFPLGTHVKILAGDVNPISIRDCSPHRAEYAPIYSQLDRAAANPFYEPEREDQDSLMRGLYMTSWLVEDMLDCNDAYGAEGVLITSASSKTSIALAHCAKQRGKLVTVGLTSPGNVAFCESLGCYDKLRTYDDIGSLGAERRVVLVDMAGSAEVRSSAHHHFADNMKFSLQVGVTHYDETGSPDGLTVEEDLPGATPEFFFAPGHVQTRSQELGGAELMRRLVEGYVGFRQFCDGWLCIQQSNGPEAVEQTYQAILAGKTDPATGQIISMR